jgi:hypothetical protein
VLLKAGVLSPEQVPDEYDPEFWSKTAVPFARGFTGPGKEPKTREVKYRNPDGSESIKIVKDEPGQEFTSAAEPPKPEGPACRGAVL